MHASTDSDRDYAKRLAISYGYDELTDEFKDGDIIIAYEADDPATWLGVLWYVHNGKHAFIDYLGINRGALQLEPDQTSVAIGLLNACCYYLSRLGIKFFHGRVYCPNGLCFDPSAGFTGEYAREDADFLTFESVVTTISEDGGTIDISGSDRSG